MTSNSSSRVTEREISPKLAEQHLGTMRNNRKLKTAYVNVLAARMMRGEWGSSEILFDNKGHLVDGQHRMHALIKSGMTLRFRIREGVSKRDLYLIDTAAPRSLADQIRMFRPEIKNVNLMVSMTRICATLLSGYQGQSVRMGNIEEFEVYFAFFEKDIVPVANVAVAQPPGHPSRTSGPLGALAFVRHANPQVMDELAVHVLSGLDLKEDHPAYVYRRYLEWSVAKFGRVSREEAAQKLMSCAYAFIHGDKVRRVYASPQYSNFFRDAYDGEERDRLFEKMLPFRNESRIGTARKSRYDFSSEENRDEERAEK